MLKYGKLSLIRNPKAIFESGRTIGWQFDMYHGNGNLDKEKKYKSKWFSHVAL